MFNTVISITHTEKKHNCITSKHYLSEHLRPLLNSEFTEFSSETCRGAIVYGIKYATILKVETYSIYYLFLLYYYYYYIVFYILLHFSGPIFLYSLFFPGLFVKGYIIIPDFSLIFSLSFSASLTSLPVSIYLLESHTSLPGLLKSYTLYTPE